MFDYSDVFLSLGSNVGPRQENLEHAISRLTFHPRISIEDVSDFYETQPRYDRQQPDFLNCVVKISTDLEPEELLSICQQIERELGRSRSELQNEPRPIDIDIVFFGGVMIRRKALRIPHKRYSERRFVLLPLSEIAPNFICPDSGLAVKKMLHMCRDHFRVEHYRLEMNPR